LHPQVASTGGIATKVDCKSDKAAVRYVDQGLITPAPVSYLIQIVWKIPEELMKRVSYAQFISTLCLDRGVVNYYC
jgi:hypothetical protein